MNITISDREKEEAIAPAWRFKMKFFVPVWYPFIITYTL